MATAKRTPLRKTADKKIAGVRDGSGKFKDSKSNAKAHRADVVAGSKSVVSKKSKAAVAKKAVVKKVVAVKLAAKKPATKAGPKKIAVKKAPSKK